MKINVSIQKTKINAWRSLRCANYICAQTRHVRRGSHTPITRGNTLLPCVIAKRAIHLSSSNRWVELWLKIIKFLADMLNHANWLRIHWLSRIEREKNICFMWIINNCAYYFELENCDNALTLQRWCLSNTRTPLIPAFDWRIQISTRVLYFVTIHLAKVNTQLLIKRPAYFMKLLYHVHQGLYSPKIVRSVFIVMPWEW